MSVKGVRRYEGHELSPIGSKEEYPVPACCWKERRKKTY